MLKFLSVFVALMMWFGAAFAAVEVNQASAQELAQIKGIGAVTAERIVEERAKGEFSDWSNFVERVKGVGPTKAQSLSDSGLTVGGKAFSSAAGTPPTPGNTKK